MPFDSADSASFAWGSVALPDGSVFWMRHEGAEHEAVVTDGALFYNGAAVTPNGFALAVTRRPTNAWTTVWIRRPGEEFRLADDLRAESRGEKRAPKARPVARVARPKPRRVLSLIPFLVRAGGLRDPGGDVLAILGGSHRVRPGLISGRGLSLDAAASLAVENGFFPEHAVVSRRSAVESLAGGLAEAGRDCETITPAILLEALDEELRGNLCWPDGVAPEAESLAAAAEADRFEMERDALRWREVVAALAAGGPAAALAFLAAESGVAVAAPAPEIDPDCPF